MKFEYIRIKEGLAERKICFGEKVNLIHSEENSCGKTTLIRFMLYALGYGIPNTKKIAFEQCEVELHLISSLVGKVILLRYNQDLIDVVICNSKSTFMLPYQLNELHSLIFGTDNNDILRNILGTFYIDQEKGWTLLNRGVVIGSIHFNIEEFIRGLSGRDCQKEKIREIQLVKEISKYKQMFSIAQYKKKLEEESGGVAFDDYDETIDVSINQINMKINSLNKEIQRIDNTIADNKKFIGFVEDMKILVKVSEGQVIQVTKDNIIGFNDTIELLMAKRKIAFSKIISLKKEIDALMLSKESELEYKLFEQGDSIAAIFDRRIVSLPMNQVAINEAIDTLEKKLKNIRKVIKERTRVNNEIINFLFQNVQKYLTEFGLNDKNTVTEPYLFTSNLKELSGAILHKTVFAFRLAYVNAVKKILNIRLPIILDSPSGKEVDQENVRLMMNVLKRDFYEHQIIIASIYKYEFDDINVIKIKERLITM